MATKFLLSLKSSRESPVSVMNIRPLSRRGPSETTPHAHYCSSQFNPALLASPLYSPSYRCLVPNILFLPSSALLLFPGMLSAPLLSPRPSHSFRPSSIISSLNVLLTTPGLSDILFSELSSHLLLMLLNLALNCLPCLLLYYAVLTSPTQQRLTEGRGSVIKFF